MKTTKLFLVSPREPCGATWLINCFLVLGIKTYRTTIGDDMWIKERAGWVLNSSENSLKKWLPALSEVRHFLFREDVEVEWAHFWPTGKTANAKVIYFVRDPRDALFSRYRRESPDATYREFLDFPDEQTLLGKIETWQLFNESWLAQPDLMVFRFEDYKRDAMATLGRVLDFMGVVVAQPALQEAIDRSSFEQAVAAERRYRELHPDDRQLINRASSIGSWKDPSLAAEVTEIVARCGGLLARFGYLDASTQSTEPSYRPHSGLLRFYRNLSVPDDFWDRPDDGHEVGRVASTMTFALAVNAAQLNRYHLEPYERWRLLSAIREFLLGLSERRNQELSELQAASSTTLNIAWRVNDFLNARRIRLPISLKTTLWKLARIGKAAFAFRGP